MDVTKGKGKGKGKKGNLISQTWKRCTSFGRSGSRPVKSLTQKSKSWPRLLDKTTTTPFQEADQDQEKHARKRRVAPEGCFSVYVGTEKQRFVVKTEYANHPLFKILLEEAESEYGYNPEGPLVLPCKVDVFCKVLVAMDDSNQDDDDDNRIRQGCGFAKNYYGSYHLLSPSRLISMNQF